MVKLTKFALVYILISLFLFILVQPAYSFSPQDNINLRGVYGIFNGTTINTTSFYQGGNLVLDTSDESNLDVNSSTYWGVVSSYLSRWFYADSTVLSFNETRLNDTIDARAVGSDVNKTYVDAQNIVFNDSIKSYADATFITQANEGNLNVNSSTYWGELANVNAISLNWTQLQNYPVSCPTGTFVTQINDTITCTAPTAADVDAGTFPAGTFTFSGAVDMNSNLIRNIDYIRFLDASGYPIRLRGDTDSGIYYNATDFFYEWRLNGANALSLDLDTGDLDIYGNVGIGTESPTQKLDISGTGYDGIQLRGGSGAGTFINFGYTADTDVGSVYVDNAAQKMQFRVQGNDRMVIQNNGNIGLGTTSPDTKAEIVGSVAITSQNNYSSDPALSLDFFSSTARVLGYGAGAYQPLQLGGSYVTLNEDGTEYIRLTGGNFGIGTTNPVSKFHTVVANSEAWVNTFNSANQYKNSISHQNGGTPDGNYMAVNIAQDASTTLEIMRIRGDYRVGINSTSPDAMLAVGGNATFKGDVNIGNNGGTVAKLEVSGNILTTQNVTANRFDFNGTTNICIFYNGSAIVINNNASGVTCP